MRFLLDEDLSDRVADIARRLGLDVLSVHDIGRRGLSDREQIDFAAAEQRTLVTRNRDDFIRLTIEAFHAGSPHCGLLIVPRSLPNSRPERIAYALKRWHEKRKGWTELGPYVIDFL